MIRFADSSNRCSGGRFGAPFPSPAFLGEIMKIKSIQIFWLAVATLFVAGLIWFVTHAATVAALAGAFTGVISLFLGVDIVTMIHKTRGLKKGDYQAVNTHRYLIALCIFALLLAEAFVLYAKFGRDVNSLYLCFGVGFLVVIGGLIGGVECNKIATDEGPKN